MSIKLADNYFSEALKWTIVIGTASVSGYLILTAQYQWVVFILAILSLVSFSAKYVLEVDTEKKIIIDSFYVLWIRIKSEEFNFITLNGIRLDKQRHTYNASTRSRVRQADFNEYIGTLEYDQNKSIELTRKMEYQSIVDELQSFARQLNIPISRTF
jgi:hypothetical protein